MPIRREFRKFYGRVWQAYRSRLIELHGAFCQVCGRECEEYLNLCHLERDPARSSLVELRCPHCHGVYDREWNSALARRTRARKVGQLWLLPEIEYAPAPLSTIPPEALRRMVKGAQGRLFSGLLLYDDYGQNQQEVSYADDPHGGALGRARPSGNRQPRRRRARAGSDLPGSGRAELPDRGAGLQFEMFYRTRAAGE